LIRSATAADAAAILAIYEPAVLRSVATFETSVPAESEMARRVESTIKRYPWLVFEREDRVVAYAYAGVYHPRPAYAWSCEVSVYVHEAARGMGAGKALLRALVEELRGAGFVNVMARIALPNDASVRLFESHGFARTGTAREIGFKLGRWVDVGEWQRQVNPRGREPRLPAAPA
jgi:L-amino acid N-acyltransferase YncA